MTERYVSKTGDDTDGLSWATAYNTFGQAYTDAVDGADTINIDDGVYTGSEMECGGGSGYALIAKAMTIKARNDGQATFAPSSATAGLRFNGNWAGDTLRVEGLVIDDSDTAPNYAIWVANSSTVGTLEVVDCTLTNQNFYGVYIDNSGDAMNVTMTGCTHSSAKRGMFNAASLTDGDIVISDCTTTITGSDNGTAGIFIDASAAGVTASVTDCTVNHTSNGAVGRGIRIMNVDDALIDGCTVTMQSSATDTCIAIHVDVDDATLFSRRAIMRNNTVYNYATGGHCLFIGHEETSAYDDLMNDGHIFNNTVTGNDTFREGGGHSISFGFCTDGNSYGNRLDQISLGVLCKGATGGGHFANYITNFGKESDNSGSAIQSKGCTNTKYYGNTVLINATCYGAGFVANEYATGPVNNTGVEVESNIFKITEATDPATEIMSTTDASQAVTFKKNGYINADLLEATHTTNQAMAYQGTARDIAYWEANVEDDASFDNDAESLVIISVGEVNHYLNGLPRNADGAIVTVSGS